MNTKSPAQRRKEKLAEELRKNLKRRKELARSANSPSGAGDGSEQSDTSRRVFRGEQR